VCPALGSSAREVFHRERRGVLTLRGKGVQQSGIITKNVHETLAYEKDEGNIGGGGGGGDPIKKTTNLSGQRKYE